MRRSSTVKQLHFDKQRAAHLAAITQPHTASSSMPAFVLLKPDNATQRERFLARLDGEHIETTMQPIVAKRFHTYEAGRAFASSVAPLIDDWRIVKR